MLKSLFERVQAMPARHKNVFYVGAGAWAARTALVVVGGVDLYTEFQKVSFADALQNPETMGKTAFYAGAWVFLKAMQWGCYAYAATGLARKPGAM